MSDFDLRDREALQRFLFRQRRILCQVVSDVNHAIEYNKLTGIDVPDDELTNDAKIDILGNGVNKLMKDVSAIKEVVIEKAS